MWRSAHDSLRGRVSGSPVHCSYDIVKRVVTVKQARGAPARSVGSVAACLGMGMQRRRGTSSRRSEDSMLGSGEPSVGVGAGRLAGRPACCLRPSARRAGLE
jgi:hypothetical protein